MPFIALILFGVIALWISSVVFLNKRFLKLTRCDLPKKVVITNNTKTDIKTRKTEDKILARKKSFAASKAILKKARKKRKTPVS